MYVMYIITLKAYLFSIQFAQLIFAINKMLDDLSFMCAEEIQAEEKCSACTDFLKMGSADADKNSFGCVANIIWLDNTFQNQNIFQVRNQGYLDNNINVYNLLQVNQYELQICETLRTKRKCMRCS